MYTHTSIHYIFIYILCCLVAKSCLTLCKPMDCSPSFLCPWDFPGKNSGVACHFLLQGIFSIQGSNACLLGRWVLSHWATRGHKYLCIYVHMNGKILGGQSGCGSWGGVLGGDFSFLQYFYSIWENVDSEPTSTYPSPDKAELRRTCSPRGPAARGRRPRPAAAGICATAGAPGPAAAALPPRASPGAPPPACWPPRPGSAARCRASVWHRARCSPGLVSTREGTRAKLEADGWALGRGRWAEPWEGLASAWSVRFSQDDYLDRLRWVSGGSTESSWGGQRLV